MKVYIVTSGSYSDYGIHKVFSTEEEAKKYIDAVGTDDNWEVEEYEVDPTDWKDSRGIYCIEIDRMSGNVYVGYRYDETERFADHNKGDCFQYKGGDSIRMWLKCNSREAVKKVAAERWMQIKALQPVAFPYMYENVVVDYRHFGLPCHEYPLYNFFTKEIVLSDTEKLDIPKDDGNQTDMKGVVILC
jgi:predicted GIY-YIG superfamily endonuclease